MSYRVHLQTRPLADLDDVVLEHFAEALDRERKVKAPVAAADLSTRTLSAVVSVDDDSPGDAAMYAVTAFEKAAQRANVGAIELSEVLVEAEDESGERHELVSGGEVARRLGLSRERIRQLVELEGRFPTPAAIVGGYRVWRWGDIRDWAELNERKVARRRKKTA